MYRCGYSRRGFRFGWLPFALGFVFLMMLFSGGFRHMWFFVWPLFCVLPFVFAAVAFAVFGRHRWHGGQYKRKHVDFWRDDDEKPKRGGDSESEIFYV